MLVGTLEYCEYRSTSMSKLESTISCPGSPPECYLLAQEQNQSDCSLGGGHQNSADSADIDIVHPNIWEQKQNFHGNIRKINKVEDKIGFVANVVSVDSAEQTLVQVEFYIFYFKYC